MIRIHNDFIQFGDIVLDLVFNRQLESFTDQLSYWEFFIYKLSRNLFAVRFLVFNKNNYENITEIIQNDEKSKINKIYLDIVVNSLRME